MKKLLFIILLLIPISVYSLDFPETNSKVVEIYDLNDNKVYQPLDNFIENNGTLTIKRGTLISQTGTNTISNNNYLNLLNITINSLSSTNTIIVNNLNSTSDINNLNTDSNSTIINNSGLVNVNSGKLKTKNIPIINNSTATLNILGGSIIKPNSNAQDRNFGIDNSGILNMSGGNIETHGYGGTYTHYSGSGINNELSGTVTITGGTFNIIEIPSTEESTKIINNKGTANISNISSNYRLIAYNSGTLTMDNVTMTTEIIPVIGFDSGLMNTGTMTLENSSILTNSGDILKNMSTGILYVNNTSFSGGGTMILNIDDAEVNVDGITITGTNTSFYSSSSNIMNVENSNVSTNGYVFDQNGTGTINIKNGTYTSNEENAIYVRSAGTVNIGDISGVPSVTDPRIIGEKYGIWF